MNQRIVSVPSGSESRSSSTGPNRAIPGGGFALFLLVAELCFICPECRSLDVHVTVPSQVGAYCRCDAVRSHLA